MLETDAAYALFITFAIVATLADDADIVNRFVIPLVILFATIVAIELTEAVRAFATIFDAVAILADEAETDLLMLFASVTNEFDAAARLLPMFLANVMALEDVAKNCFDTVFTICAAELPDAIAIFAIDLCKNAEAVELAARVSKFVIPATVLVATNDAAEVTDAATLFATAFANDAVVADAATILLLTLFANADTLATIDAVIVNVCVLGGAAMSSYIVLLLSVRCCRHSQG